MTAAHFTGGRHQGHDATLGQLPDAHPRIVLAESARPDPIHQNPLAVVGAGFVVHARDPDPDLHDCKIISDCAPISPFRCRLTTNEPTKFIGSRQCGRSADVRIFTCVNLPVTRSTRPDSAQMEVMT
jgi:hypothetical protein